VIPNGIHVFLKLRHLEFQASDFLAERFNLRRQVTWLPL